MSFNRIPTNRSRRRKGHAKSLLGKCPVTTVTDQIHAKICRCRSEENQDLYSHRVSSPRYFLIAKGKTVALQWRRAVDCALTK